jgi:hypothetical protein
MSASRAYITVEGPHDVELIAALLRPEGFKRVQFRKDLDPYWHRLVPEKFPYRDDLLARVPVPIFFQSGERGMALHAAGGETNLISKVEETISVLPSPPTGLGVILDADSTKPPIERFDRIAAGLQKCGVEPPAAPGEISAAVPRCGVYVLPDNLSQGTLEDLLLECGAAVYPGLLGQARTFISGIDPDAAELAGDDMKDFGRGAGRNKATIASMASVLRPGKAIQNSIQDNRWLKDPRSLALPRIAAVRDFLLKLIAP